VGTTELSRSWAVRGLPDHKIVLGHHSPLTMGFMSMLIKLLWYEIIFLY
jgi:hypothetical protein